MISMHFRVPRREPVIQAAAVARREAAGEKQQTTKKAAHAEEAEALASLGSSRFLWFASLAVV
jgi:hypothetical protein